MCVCVCVCVCVCTRLQRKQQALQAGATVLPEVCFNVVACVCVCTQGVRVVLEDGAAHAVDSSEIAFKIAALMAFKQVSC